MLIGIFQLTHAQYNVHANGQLTNTNGTAVSVWLTLFEGSTTTSATAITDASGNFSHVFTATTNTGTVFMHVDDCNSDSIIETLPFNLPNADTIVNFTTFDYCPNTTSNCNAYFSVNQATTANGSIVPGTLVVTDSSTGSNLTYTWYFGDGTSGTGTQLTHAYASNGPYALCLTVDDGAGCTDSFCDTISVDSLGLIIEEDGFNLIIGEHSLGLNNNDISSSVVIFPNPATDNINIKLDAIGETLNTISMFDLSGKLVHQVNMSNYYESNIVTINTENLEAGTYLVQMSFNDRLINKKVIIK